MQNIGTFQSKRYGKLLVLRGTYECDRDLLNFILVCFAITAPAILCWALMLLYLDGYWSRR